MPVNTKVHGGTRDGSGPQLCNTCAHGMVMRGECEGQDVIRCDYLARNVSFKVTSCSRYYDKTQPSKSDLYEIAWILETSKNRRNIGFVPWKEYREKHPEERDGPPMGF